MTRRSILTVSIPAIWLSLCSCQRIPDDRPFTTSGPGVLPIEAAQFPDAVPIEYGDLIGVTSRADYPAWTQAWFMKPDRSIVVLWINSQSGQIFDRALLIPRR
jgi:hypothetical protein